MRGTVNVVEAIGQIIYVTVQLPNAAPVRIEAYRDRIEGRGIDSGAAIDLAWNPQRATVVLGDG